MSRIRIAIASTWAGRRVDVARAGVIAAAVFLVTLLVSMTTGSLLALRDADQRAQHRNLDPVQPGEKAVYERSVRWLALDGDQVIIVLLQRLSPDAPPIPGLPADPEAGVTYLSPALLRRIGDRPAFADLVANSATIEPAGVAWADELFSYRFVDDRADLPGNKELLSARPSRYPLGVGHEATHYWFATAALVATASLGALRAALGPGVGTLEARFELFDKLGASGRFRAEALALATIIVGAPAAIAAAILWARVAAGLSSVPMVGYPVARGDLATSGWVLALAVISVLLALFVLQFLPARRRPLRSRASDARPGPRLVRVVPVLACIGLILTGAALGGTTGTKLFLAGAFASAVTLPLALPVLIAAGAEFIPQTGLTGLLVARRAGAEVAFGSLGAFIMLAVIAPLGAAWVSFNRQPDVVVQEPSDQTHTILVQGGELSPSLRADLEIATNGVLVDLYESENGEEFFDEAGNGHIAESTLTWVSPCSRPIAHGSGLTCDGGVPGPARVLRDLGKWGVYAPEVPANATRIGTIVVSRASDAEDIVRALVWDRDPGLSVLGVSDEVTHESPLVALILAGAAVLGTVAAFSLLMSVLTQGSMAARSRRKLIAVGADRRQAATIAAVESALLVWCSGASATLLGALLVRAFGELAATTTATTTMWISCAASTAAAFLAAAAAAGSTWAAAGEGRPE